MSSYKDCNQEIINLSSQGFTARKIAERLGVSKTLISRHYKELGIRPLTLSEARKTHSGPNKGKKMSKEFCKKVGDFWRGKPQSPEFIKKRAIAISKTAKRGKEHPLWMGGNSRKSRYYGQTFPYRQWRRTILNRDGHCCTICKSTYRLEIDHIKPWSLYPDLRYDLNNGRTLCRKCHKQTPTYGIKLIRKTLSPF